MIIIIVIIISSAPLFQVIIMVTIHIFTTNIIISRMKLFQSPAFFRGLLPLGEDSVLLGLVSVLHTYLVPSMPNSPVSESEYSAIFKVEVQIAATSALLPSSHMLCTRLLPEQSLIHSLPGVVFLGSTCKRFDEMSPHLPLSLSCIHFHFPQHLTLSR